MDSKERKRMREKSIQDRISALEGAREEGKLEVAKKLLIANVDMDIIVFSTGLSEDELLKIKNEL
ncbi:TPA: hypothetical protein ACF32C_002800 [Clostridium perfringens]|jgi:predicted transposase/invertase (TIGR01784 family)|uniref:hypothetical protein n=1 Tax=Clostridium perfringens TaxID=1502 RepID=UPI001FAC94F6|nr:hypothetical protein [Clostridium perfringens]MCX0354738.1 hypothetical protein [Clostridium perfringens]MDK0548253.1 hypothetical protein [Clostridium perfringens]MDK0654365.1 hypothetical protein [Clostridium perfringens]MDK0754815.1 hypothetical protein [Clostridium perfringens]MDK0758014.1 hypothetical protein [Clostridium perfringens]